MTAIFCKSTVRDSTKPNRLVIFKSDNKTDEPERYRFHSKILKVTHQKVKI